MSNSAMRNITKINVLSMYGLLGIPIFGCLFYLARLNAVLVYLDGPSSSGKSSICNVLREQQRWGVVASLYWDWAQDHLAQLFPSDFPSVHMTLPKNNIIHALRRNIIFFKEGVSQNQKEDAKHAIETIQTVLNNQSNSTLYDLHMRTF